MKNFNLFILLILGPLVLQAQTLKTSVFSSGGGAALSANYKHFGTFGQPLSAGATGTNHINREGFIFAQQNEVRVIITDDQTICYDTEAAQLSSAVTNSEGTITYQWQKLVSSNWQDISNEISDTYAPGSLTETSFYRR